MRLSRAGSQRTRSKRRNHVLKAYCRKCRYNHAGVYRRTKIVCSTVKELGISLETVPTRKLTKKKRSQQELGKDVMVRELGISGPK